MEEHGGGTTVDEAVVEEEAEHDGARVRVRRHGARHNETHHQLHGRAPLVVVLGRQLRSRAGS
jgi:hypothetical protein